MWVIPTKAYATWWGGYYFTYSETKPIKFNPFFIGEGDTLDTEKKETNYLLRDTCAPKDKKQAKISAADVRPSQQ